MCAKYAHDGLFQVGSVVGAAAAGCLVVSGVRVFTALARAKVARRFSSGHARFRV